MTENKLIVDEITTLRLLFSLRENMQKYSCGSQEPQVMENLLQGYALFADAAEINSKIYHLIEKQVVPSSFNPYAFKSCDADEHKKQKKEANKNQAQLKVSALLKKQISEELDFQHSLGKMTDVPLEAEFSSVKIADGAFLVFVENRQEPLAFPLRQRNGKFFSSLGTKALNNPLYAKKGFDNKTYKLLEAAGEKGVALLNETQKLATPQKYSPSQYKTYLGLAKNASLNDVQQKELNILNELFPVEQKRFILAVKERTNEQKNHKNFFDKLNKVDNLVQWVGHQGNLSKLFTENNLPDASKVVEQQIVQKLMKDDKVHVWNCFVKNNELNARFSYYDILVDNVLTKNKTVFQNVLNFDEPKKMKENIKTAYAHLKKSSLPVLPDYLAAELFTLGVFKQGMFSSPSQKQLENMNLVLNEFGLNIKFITEKVVQAPNYEISSAQEQSKIDRACFEESKKSPASKNQEKIFQLKLAKMGIDTVDHRDIHHYVALRNQAFIKTNLNQQDNYVHTARQHPWNRDAHDFVHNFDVSGEFLVSDDGGKYSLLDFNSLRKAFNGGKSLFLQIPILQEKSKDGKFYDLLPCKRFGAEEAVYVSSDSNARHFVQIPAYLCDKVKSQNHAASLEV